MNKIPEGRYFPEGWNIGEKGIKEVKRGSFTEFFLELGSSITGEKFLIKYTNDLGNEIKINKNSAINYLKSKGYESENYSAEWITKTLDQLKNRGAEKVHKVTWKDHILEQQNIPANPEATQAVQSPYTRTRKKEISTQQQVVRNLRRKGIIGFNEKDVKAVAEFDRRIVELDKVPLSRREIKMKYRALRKLKQEMDRFVQEKRNEIKDKCKNEGLQEKMINKLVKLESNKIENRFLPMKEIMKEMLEELKEQYKSFSGEKSETI